MSARLKVYAIIAAVVAAVVGYQVLKAHWRADGARDATIAALLGTARQQKVALELDSARLAHLDTVRVFRQVVRTDTVLQRLIDSAIVHHHDTVTVTREVLVEAKAALDSTKKAADACCTLARDWRARWFTTDSLYRLVLERVPSPAKAWVDRAEGAGFCAGAVWLASKLAKP